MENIIGKTPMIQIKYKYQGNQRYIYAKLEAFNMTGSIKDRMASYIIQRAKQRKELKPGQAIVEATSGNTGISLSAIGAKENHPVYIFMPDWVSEERVKIMESYGATVKLFSAQQGGFRRCIQEAQYYASKINGFYVNQFANRDNVMAHYQTTGLEILEQVHEPIGGFVSGIGTGGTLMGVGRRLKKQDPSIVLAAIEPDKMPLLSKNRAIGQHKIEGIGDDFIPEIVDRNMIDTVIVINDDDAVNMARLIAKKLGLGVGISSGANFLGAVILREKIDLPVVTVFPDDNKKYLSTDLAKNVDNSEGMISNHVELVP